MVFRQKLSKTQLLPAAASSPKAAGQLRGRINGQKFAGSISAATTVMALGCANLKKSAKPHPAASAKKSGVAIFNKFRRRPYPAPPLRTVGVVPKQKKTINTK